ncbi:MAG: hypothetical protein MRZ79_08045 [Bacteroidia bacterium]|nr:hypothetical protein [Bacteroidia bacterium]
MNINAFHYRLLTSLFQGSKSLNFPTLLREIIRKKDIEEVHKLDDFFLNELQQASFETQASVDYFLFITKESLLTSFYRRDFTAFEAQLEVILHRMVALKAVAYAPGNINSWEEFFALLKAALLRLIRHDAIETYESHISDIDWSLFDKSFIAQVSNIIGFTYLHEDNQEQKQKARIWLMKALGEFENDEKLNASLSMALYFINEHASNSVESIQQVIEQIKSHKENLGNKELEYLFEGAILELRAQVLRIKTGLLYAEEDYEKAQTELRELESAHSALDKLPSFANNQISRALAHVNANLSNLVSDELEKASHMKAANQRMESAIENLKGHDDEANLFHYRLEKAAIAIHNQSPQTEKEMKELVQFFKKRQDHPYYLLANEIYIGLHQNNGSTKKSYDLIQEIFKLGLKKIEYGGFYLQNEGLKLANHVFLFEKEQPGVSWMVEILDDFFAKILQTNQSLDENLEIVKQSLAEDFRAACVDFEPISHFNIKVFFQYQLLQIQLLKLGSKIVKDDASLAIAERLLNGLASKNNPMNFISATWEEFKDVPNEVRNKTLNKCIDITKGDLPAAANHLDFSYRNLRSYITFKEVNRLGFFLDRQETNNRQLELGIRYMFYDLYKQGTIFEVVFDMPKFLVQHSNDGFYSQDLEEELSIKGTTAKKYIKIMIENGIIKQDKTTGRRHYYKLIRENVMNRLGKDQNTLIQSAQ